jgi:hypothetical protein
LVLLPTRTLEQVLDENELTKLNNARAEGNTKLENEIIMSVYKEIQPRRLDLSPEQVIAEATKFTTEAKARRLVMRAERKKSRAAHVAKMFSRRIRKTA